MQWAAMFEGNGRVVHFRRLIKKWRTKHSSKKRSKAQTVAVSTAAGYVK
jgi:hypothetical protein